MRYFLTIGNDPIQYISSGNLISKREFLHPKRNIDTFVLIMVKEGILYIAQNGINYEIHPKQYIVLHANEEHYGYRPSACKLSYNWVHFTVFGKISTIEGDSHELEHYMSDLMDSGQNFYVMPEYGEIALTKRAPLLFNQLLDLSRQELIYSRQMVHYALSLLVMEITQEFIEMTHQRAKNIPQNIGIIMEWIKANYYRPLSVVEIAGEFGYNADYLSAAFKKATGHSLVHFINKTRIDISKALITDYNVSIKEAAYSCGFPDEKYFMKTFKKYEDMTPSQYKKAFTKKMIN